MGLLVGLLGYMRVSFFKGTCPQVIYIVCMALIDITHVESVRDMYVLWNHYNVCSVIGVLHLCVKNINQAMSQIKINIDKK